MTTTYIYVSNADDGDISSYRMRESGELVPLGRTAAGNAVMPMVVSPDRRFLFACVRSKPYTVHTYRIDGGTGALTLLSSAPLVDSFPFITLDCTGRYLLCASYAGNLISVNAVSADGRVDPQPLQVIPVGRNAHSIRVHPSNRFVYVPTLGSDAIFIFDFDAATGRLTSATPALCLMKEMTGPRHFVMSSDGKFMYVLSEFLATVTTFAIDAQTGQLTVLGSINGLPTDTRLGPGVPRGANAGRNVDNDIWAADIQITPDGKFLYISERTGSTIGAFSVDAVTGTLTYLASTPTETQPRGFAIEPAGQFLIASGEKSETIAVYAIDAHTGALEAVGKYPTGKGANWVQAIQT